MANYRHFKAWLKFNKHRFIREPYIAKVRRDSFYIYFRGLRNNLFVQINFKNSIFSLWSNLEAPYRELWDWVGDFDLHLKKDSYGFYCDFCLERKYYKMKHQLYEEHSFNALLVWCNEKLVKGNYIVHHGIVGSHGGTMILDETQFKQFDKEKIIQYLKIA